MEENAEIYMTSEQIYFTNFLSLCCFVAILFSLPSWMEEKRKRNVQLRIPIASKCYKVLEFISSMAALN